MKLSLHFSLSLSVYPFLIENNSGIFSYLWMHRCTPSIVCNIFASISATISFITLSSLFFSNLTLLQISRSNYCPSSICHLGNLYLKGCSIELNHLGEVSTFLCLMNDNHEEFCCRGSDSKTYHELKIEGLSTLSCWRCS